ncbi:MAG: anhydro-N-acetylmuramic acid kinase [Woeseiaceae bacterium]|nr:anhydro-N-acetylmuramic acid kinase [Woeseiaceae bacterium]
MTDLYIGLMSGTSMDGVDAALVRFGDHEIDLIATHQHDYPGALRHALVAARSLPDLRRSDQVPDLHRLVGECFRDAAIELLDSAGVDASTVLAIGSHGQTLRHAPDASEPYSLQIGDPDLIAAGTGIATIADFRRADIALGGQGAPLAPAFHEWLFRREGATRVVVNIGGIANITVLFGDDRPTIGFDTGPGNTLLDAWISAQGIAAFDAGGDWSAAGRVIDELLQRLLADAYFQEPAPKSTGFEHFNLDWLAPALTDVYDATDIQSTLCQLTAQTVASAILEAAPETTEVLVCGGGVHNADLMARLGSALENMAVESTAAAGLDPDLVEAVAFAWLAMRTSGELPGNLPSVTGASEPAVLGSLHPAG